MHVCLFLLSPNSLLSLRLFFFFFKHQLFNNLMPNHNIHAFTSSPSCATLLFGFPTHSISTSHIPHHILLLSLLPLLEFKCRAGRDFCILFTNASLLPRPVLSSRCDLISPLHSACINTCLSGCEVTFVFLHKLVFFYY